MTNQCLGKTKQGRQCKNKVLLGQYCFRHKERIVAKEPEKKEIAKRFIAEKPEDCPICCFDLHMNEPLECGHWVHHECILKSGKKECPFCRKTLNIEGEVVKYEPEEPNAEETRRLIYELSELDILTFIRAISGLEDLTINDIVFVREQP